MISKNALGNLSLFVVSPDRTVDHTLRLDPIDQLVLKLSRYLFLRPDSPVHPMWRAARRVARRHLPLQDASVLIQSLWRIAESLEQTRQSDFPFIHGEERQARMFITREERSLVRLIHFMRIGNSAAALSQAIVLCQGGDSTVLIEEARKLGQILRVAAEPAQQKTS